MDQKERDLVRIKKNRSKEKIQTDFLPKFAGANANASLSSEEDDYNFFDEFEDTK